MKKQTKAYLLALLAVLFWSTIASALKISLRHISFELLLFYSATVATLFLFALLAVQNRLKEAFHITRKEYIRSAVLGFLNPFIYYMGLLKAYDMLRAQEAGTLNYIWPLILALLSIPVLKQKIPWQSIFAILISFSGLVIISTRGRVLEMQFEEPLGVVLILISAVIWASYWLINMKDKREVIPKLFLNFLFGIAYAFVYLTASGKLALPSVNGLLGSLWVGIFELGLTFVIWLRALGLSSNTAKVSQLVYLSPFISLFFIQFIVKETIVFPTIIGLILIITGIMLQQYLDQRERKASRLSKKY
jgi:drug/metabolite transporter (DMT)-like permease